MKLSIISGVYKNSHDLNSFLKRMNSQTCNDFELILTVNTNQDKVLETIEEWAEEKKFYSRIKVVFNTKRQGRTKGMIQGMNFASGKYILYTSTADRIKKDMVERSVEYLEKTNADIVEFRPSFKGLLKWSPKLRYTSPKEKLISENPIVLAKTYPLLLNKFIKASLVKKVNFPKSWSDTNSRLAIDWLFIALLEAKTYSTVDETLITSTITQRTTIFNPLILFRQWKNIAKLSESKGSEYRSELMYNAYFHIVVMLARITVETKNDVLLKKLFKVINKSIEEDYAPQFISNKYILRNDEEAKYLSVKKSLGDLKKIEKVFFN